MADTLTNEDLVVIFYGVESVTNMLHNLYVHESGRIVAERINDVTERGRSGESTIEQDRVKSLAERLLEAMKRIGCDPVWDDDEEDRYSIDVKYQGRIKKVQWVWDPPQHNTPARIEELVSELECIYQSVPLNEHI